MLAGSLVPGGWSAILAAARAAGKLKIVNWSTGFDQPNTMFAGLIGGAFLSMASHGADQLIVQRLLSARSLKASQVAVIGSGVAVIFQFALFLMLGVGLWAFYGGEDVPDARLDLPDVHRRPHAARTHRAAPRRGARGDDEHALGRDQLARRGVDARHLPAAHRQEAPTIRRRCASDGWFALIWGVVLTGGALLFPQNAKTPVVVVALSIASFTYGGLLGGFFLAIFWRRARQSRRDHRHVGRDRVHER